MITVCEALQEQANHQPTSTAFTYLIDGEEQTESLTFGELAQTSLKIAGHLREKIPPSSRALIVLEPGLDFVTALFACFQAGIIAVPTPLPAFRINSRSAQRFASLVQDAKPHVILTHSRLSQKLSWFVRDQAGLADQSYICMDQITEGAAPRLENRKPDETAFIQYTSGSTSDPKGVVITHANLSANLSAIAEKFSLTKNSVVVSWLPLYHDMGLIGGLIEAVWSGYHLIFMDPKHFSQRPLRWLQAIDRFGADVSGGANFAYDLCVDAMAKSTIPIEVDLSRWRLAFSGAEPVRPSTIRRFSEQFARFGFQVSAFYPTYGLAEATLMATAPEPGTRRPRSVIRPAEDAGAMEVRPVEVTDAPPLEGASEFVSCGSPAEQTEIMIVDNDRVCPDGETGEIWIAGPGVSLGYWKAEGHAAEYALRPLPGKKERRFLATGDLGFMCQGELFVTGRSKDLIIIRGKNHVPGDIEEAATTSHPALVQNGAAAFSIDTESGEQLVVACELQRTKLRSTDLKEVLNYIRQNIADLAGLATHNVVLLRPGSLPRTTSGKLQRQACRAIYHNKGWKAVASQQEDGKHLDPSGIGDRETILLQSPRERIAHIDLYIRNQLARITSGSAAFIAPDLPLQATGLDSLKRVELTLILDQELQLNLPIDLLEQDITVGELADQIRKHAMRPLDTGNESPKSALLVPAQTVPLSPAQKTFLTAETKDPRSFLEILLLRTPATLNSGALHEALVALVDHHDAFFLRYQRIGSDWTQQIGEPGSGFAFETIDASKLQNTAFSKLRQDLIARLRSEVNLASGPLVKAFLIDRGMLSNGILMIGFHHLVVDGISLSIWVTQLEQAYKNACQGLPPIQQNPQTKFTTWLRTLQDYARSEAISRQFVYWQKVCGAFAPSAGFNPQAENSLAPEWRMEQMVHLDPVSNQQLLHRYPSGSERCSLLLAALADAWRTEVGEESLLVRLENHGRVKLSRTDPFSAIGWFTCQFPVRVTPTRELTVRDLFHETLAMFTSVPDQGIGYGLLSQGHAGTEAQEKMDKLQKPLISFQYRGGIDEAFRKDAILPVIGVIHNTEIWKEVAYRKRDPVALHLSAVLRRNMLYWHFVANSSVDEDLPQRISEGMKKFLLELLTTEHKP